MPSSWIESDASGAEWSHLHTYKIRANPDSPPVPGDRKEQIAGKIFVEYKEHWKKERGDNGFPAASMQLVDRIDTGRRYEYVCQMAMEHLEDHQISSDRGLVHIVDPNDFTVHRLQKIMFPA